jgi:hypothetical protein
MDAPITTGTGFIGLTMGELVAAVLLLISLAANLVQFSRARTRRAALHHGLGGLFNAIGWLQARDIELLRLARGRVHATASGDAKLALQEFAAHLHHEHYALRLLHEQLAATARAAGDRDPRWAGDRTEGTDEQLEPFLTRSQAV